MPKRWCQCTGCASCNTTVRTHGVLYDADTTGTLKCPPCQDIATAKRNARPSSSARGLGWKFSERKARDRAYQEATRCQCPGCPQHTGLCGEAFSAANPKTADHTTPRSQGGSSGPITAMCRRCNSARGGQLSGHRR